MTSGAGANKLQSRTRAVARPLATKLWTIEQSGYERLPDDGPAILCPNHISFLDSAFLMLTLPRNISFVGKAEYLDDWKTKYLFPALGMIPIDRSGGSKSQAALDTAEQVLRRGELFGIFPEGTRSRDGYLYKARTGAARLAMKIGCPVYPVGITGTDEIQPPDAKMPKLRRSCTIEIGRPIRPERYEGRGPEHLAWRSMMDEVMFEIREMTGQIYKNVYAGQSEAEEVVHSQVGSVSEHHDPAPDRALVAAG
ncbi:MAG: lysophospholipid acyltransferase family protein [Ilumatobacter sp.]|uniref:lysophospholipid acyltransferase family protein n=1 Tax=Ilumatobacter sp. TaxID=1967498 RepID=UPI002611013F|nr:lysophospholipid acyltransferase family protein [Ilumatobacter sp.]MDJ0767525.1 lysophospholipid acyltransferase family protein [Ilumatobacter sp.]